MRRSDIPIFGDGKAKVRTLQAVKRMRDDFILTVGGSNVK
jgi:hypothetical protein